MRFHIALLVLALVFSGCVNEAPREEVVPEVEEPDAVQFDERTETFCERCAWHGPSGEMEK